MAVVRFNNNKSEFFTTLRKRVDQYFTEKNLKTTGNRNLYLKTIILFTTLIALYTWLVFFTPAILMSVILCILLGVNIAAIGFNVMHDGSHGSYSSNPRVNKYMAFALNLLGGNAYLWNLKHNVNHHSFTNIEGMDDDIDIKPFIRVHADQPKYWFHRFQHIYGPFLYGLTYFFWVFWQDFKKYFTSKISKFTPLRKMSIAQHITFWVSKVLHLTIFIAVPAMLIGFWPVFIGYCIASFAAGIVISIVFQLAHIVEYADFIVTEDKVANVETEWAVHQLNTTTNFATRSITLGWLLGGLNFQVEHHLFPRISHVHYPKINKIVRQTCSEFNIAYNEFPTMFSAFVSHIRHLKLAGIA